MREVRKNVVIAARLNLSVLIIGEPGTGKELVAQGIHKASRRAKKPFVSINFAAINHTLIESEFLGLENRAFIPASARKPGLLRSADGGTSFLDEIGDLSPESQALLLALLREHEYENAGWRHVLKIDIRRIVATNYDLRPEIDGERFRPDLYDRINEFPIKTPPLRKPPTDIPILIQSYFPSIEFDESVLGPSRLA
jgi:transcriptional regulator with GAF, ATPase, and Fis domain